MWLASLIWLEFPCVLPVYCSACLLSLLLLIVADKHVRPLGQQEEEEGVE